MREARGVGTVRFRLEFEEFLQVEGVLYVPGLDHNLLSVPALEDAGYVTMFKRGHVFIYVDGPDPNPVMISDRVERLYWLRGQPMTSEFGGWIPDSDSEEQRAPEADDVYRGQLIVPREERESLQSTGRRLSRYGGTETEERRVDSPRSSGFRIVASRRLSVSSFVQEVSMAPASEGASTVNSVFDMRMAECSDGSLYLPR